MTTTDEKTRTAGASQILEQRHTSRPGSGVVRDDFDGAAPRFVGHAAIFDERTEIGNPLTWGWVESIGRSAFTKTLSEGDARFLIDHNSSLLVARVSAGDLRLSTDSVGLAVDSDLDVEVSYVSDLIRNLDSERITGMSFGFYVVRDTWSTEEIEVDLNGKTATQTIDVRVIDEVRLIEVSAVTFPAYESTDAGLAARCEEIRAARAHHKVSPPIVGDIPAPPTTGTRNAIVQKMRTNAIAARYRIAR